jgi:hypothetical protein
MVRLLPDQAERLDVWRRDLTDRAGRPEAIRRLVEQAIPAQPLEGRAKRARVDASKLAMREIEPLIDKSEPAEIQERRKRRLIHGPKEFRGVRKDQAKNKA